MGGKGSNLRRGPCWQGCVPVGASSSCSSAQIRRSSLRGLTHWPLVVAVCLPWDRGAHQQHHPPACSVPGMVWRGLMVSHETDCLPQRHSQSIMQTLQDHPRQHNSQHATFTYFLSLARGEATRTGHQRAWQHRRPIVRLHGVTQSRPSPVSDSGTGAEAKLIKFADAQDSAKRMTTSVLLQNPDQ